MQDSRDMMQNLRDIGCGEEMTARIFGLYQAGYVDDAVRSLRVFRGKLMDDLHERQSRVDCLDFLVRRLQKDIRKDG